MKIISNIRVGKPDTSPSKSAHVRGVRQGNMPGSAKREPGLKPEGDIFKGNSRRSTSINPKAKNAILPTMPNLSPN